MLLGWPGVDLVGVTTSTDPGGVRAGFTSYALGLAGRSEVPVCAGAEGSLGGLFGPLAFPDYWPEQIDPRPSRPGAALEALEAAALSGAVIVAVGPFTNLALLEAARPGLLESTRVVVMGGHPTKPRAGLPQWGRDDDWNVQQDRIAADVVFRRARPIVVPLAPCLETWLTGRQTARLRAAGPLGALIAGQSEAHARDNGRTELGRGFDALPDDLLNFQYDPLACAVAVGWDGVTIEDLPVGLELGPERLHMVQALGEPPLPVVTSVDGRAFEEAWLEAVERASRGPGGG